MKKAASLGETAPPHPRGSTRAGIDLTLSPAGSPAPAGIDPFRCCASSPMTGLPRTRGDRPGAQHGATIAGRAPPHPRGSTRYCAAVPPLRAGSPAPAGIDPSKLSPASIGSGLPRTRGDRPTCLKGLKRNVKAPPHPRGSTYCDTDSILCEGGSPAPAGIDPSQYSKRPMWIWLPRTRGDRPTIGPGGDGTPAAPPHPRGSTRWSQDNRHDWRGSPAPAGIDPTAPALQKIKSRLPRTRGDRPATYGAQANVSLAPPHPRGSTPGGNHH